MRPLAALRWLALVCVAPSVWMWSQVPDERAKYSILTSAAVSVLGFFLTLRLIPVTKASTLKAGLFGMDINKKGSKGGEKKIPESLGLASGVVFLVRGGRGVRGSGGKLTAILGIRSSPSQFHVARHMMDVITSLLPVLERLSSARRCPDPCCCLCRCPPLPLQICIVLFQQLHYYDTPSLVHSLRAGRWSEVLGSRKVEPVSDAW